MPISVFIKVATSFTFKIKGEVAETDLLNISSELAIYSISVLQLHSDFIENTESNTKKYADKTIETYGKITSLDLENNAIVLDEKLFLTMSEKITEDFKIQQMLKVKGRFVGFDDLVEELKMDQCEIVN